MSLDKNRTTKVIIRGDQLGSVEQFYDSLEKQLHLPNHFGRNLDALWDVLTTDVAGPVEIIWEHAEKSKVMMGETGVVLMELLQEVANERQDFKVYLK